jgi:hypothetical protein
MIDFSKPYCYWYEGKRHGPYSWEELKRVMPPSGVLISYIDIPASAVPRIIAFHRIFEEAEADALKEKARRKKRKRVIILAVAALLLLAVVWWLSN